MTLSPSWSRSPWRCRRIDLLPSMERPAGTLIGRRLRTCRNDTSWDSVAAAYESFHRHATGQRLADRTHLTFRKIVLLSIGEKLRPDTPEMLPDGSINPMLATAARTRRAGELAAREVGRHAGSRRRPTGMARACSATQRNDAGPSGLAGLHSHLLLDGEVVAFSPTAPGFRAGRDGCALRRTARSRPKQLRPTLLSSTSSVLATVTSSTSPRRTSRAARRADLRTTAGRRRRCTPTAGCCSTRPPAGAGRDRSLLTSRYRPGLRRKDS